MKKYFEKVFRSNIFMKHTYKKCFYTVHSFFYFWTNFGPKPVEFFFKLFCAPEIPNLGLLITDCYWHNKTDSYMIGPRNEGPRK